MFRLSLSDKCVSKVRRRGRDCAGAPRASLKNQVLLGKNAQSFGFFSLRGDTKKAETPPPLQKPARRCTRGTEVDKSYVKSEVMIFSKVTEF